MDLSAINKILIVRLSSLGDIILSTPLIRSIKNKYPKILIEYLLREEYRDVLRHNPYLNEVIPFSNKNTDQIKEKIRKEKYDIVIDLQNNLRSAGLLEYSRSRILKYSKRDASKFMLVHFKLNMMKNAPPVPERYAEVIPDFDFDFESPDLFTTNAPSVILNPDFQYIGFAPGAKHFTKRWLPEYYIDLGKRLTEKGYKIAVFGGRDDKESCRIVSEGIGGSLNLWNNNDLLQTAADMKVCIAVVCNDSGLMHAAAASGVPVMAFFGSTVKEFGFFPYKSKSRIVEHMFLPCRPCTHIGRSSCPKGHFKCMKELKPESAFENLLDFLNN